MYARVSTLRGAPEHIDDGIRQVRENVLPSVEQMEGYQGGYLLVDRQNGTSISITLWESEEAMRASEEAADQLRSDAAGAAGAQISSVERCEVVVTPAERGY